MIALERFPVLQALNSPEARRYLFLTYLLVLCATHKGVLMGVRVWVALFVVGALILPALAEKSAYWLAVSFTLALNLIPNYQHAANHYWLTFYTALFFMLHAYRHEHDGAPPFNVPRALLVIVFGIAGLQKIISSYFVSGRLLTGYVLDGSSLFTPLSSLYPGHEEAVLAFEETLVNISSSTLLDGTSLSLMLPDEGLPFLCLVLSVAIILFEVALFTALAVDRIFDHSGMPLLMLAFVWGTFLFRGEYAFFALLCLLFFLARPRMALLWKALFVLTIAAFLAFDVGEVGTVL